MGEELEKGLYTDQNNIVSIPDASNWRRFNGKKNCELIGSTLGRFKWSNQNETMTGWWSIWPIQSDF